MADQLHLMFLLIGIAFSVVLPVVVCFHRRLVFAKWAKIASIMACLAGLGWGFLAFMLMHENPAEVDYATNMDVKGLLGGICAGIAFSLLIARPYQKRAPR